MVRHLCLLLTLFVLLPWPTWAHDVGEGARVGDSQDDDTGKADTALSPAAQLDLRVNHAIARGVQYLKSRAAEDLAFPGWEDNHPEGTTVLAAYTLVQSGVPTRDPVLKGALDRVRNARFQTTYSASVALLLYEALGGGDSWRAAAERERDFLLSVQEGGLWSYPGIHICASNTQFALLGLRAANRMGLELPESALLSTAKGLWRWQDPNGGFSYTNSDPPTAGITAATLAGLVVLDELSEGRRRLSLELRNRSQERARAEAWLAEHFSVAGNAWDSYGAWTTAWHFAHLWALERYGGLSGKQKIAGRDWYREGAAWLVDDQNADGSWSERSYELIDTCFALLFLRRSTFSGVRDELLAEVEARAEDKQEEGPPRPGAGALRLVDTWVAGPWQGKRERSLLLDPPFARGLLAPRDRAKIAQRDWKRVSLEPGGPTNLERYSGGTGDHQLWCVVTHVGFDPEEGSESQAVSLWLELNDGWQVWFNGAKVSEGRRVQVPSDPNVHVPLVLEPGWHQIVVLVEDVRYGADFGLLLCARDGSPLPPTVRLAPDAPRGKR